MRLRCCSAAALPLIALLVIALTTVASSTAAAASSGTASVAGASAAAPSIASGLHAQRAAQPASSNWPSFRGPRSAGVSHSATPVHEWDVETGTNVRWSTPIPGYSHSSPVVWGDAVFVLTTVSNDPTTDGRRDGVRNNAIADLSEREWKIYALGRDDGHIVWERVAHRGTPRVKRHEKASHANSTPATDGRHVVAVFNSEGLFCWSMNGDLLWSRDLGTLDPGYWGQPDNNWGHASSPVIFEDTVIIQSDDFADSFLSAFHLTDGSEVWRVPRDELATWTTPLIIGEGAEATLVTQGGNHIRAYSARTGAELWSYADHAEVKVPSPFVAGDLLILSGGAPAGRHMLAMSLSTMTAATAATSAGTTSAPVTSVGATAAAASSAAGAQSPQPGRSPPMHWEIRSGGPYTSTPLAYEGLLYVARDIGVLAVYELQSGELVYRERLGTGFSASPVAADGRLYLASEDGDVYVVRAGREFELLAQNEMGEPLFATPALSGDLLVVRSRSRLFGLGSAQDSPARIHTPRPR